MGTGLAISKMKKYFPILLLIVFSLSCNKEKDFDCLKSTGKIKTEERPLPFFTKINLTDGVNLIFVEDSEQKVIVEAGEHLLPKIKTTVTGDSLVIENRNYCNWVRSLKNAINVYIHGNPGIKLYNNGFGEVKGTVSGDYFYVKSWSSENMTFELHDLKFLWLETFKIGNSTLSGTAEKIMAFRHETGRVDMRPMSYCKDMLIHDHGQGTSYIRADSALTVRIFDSGKVICVTQPDTVLYERHGSGELVFE
jgi:hypothetical protein